MTFYAKLCAATSARQEELFHIPFVSAALDGELTLTEYRAFLAQAYHHVKHTVPLLMRVGAELPERHAWLRQAVATYITEEIGHEQWILADIAACGGDPEAARRQGPERPCEVMVAYAYDMVSRRDPLGFFGMVHVLEGTSARGATRAAECLRERLELPAEAVTYLTTHGDLDLDHVDFFEELMDRIDDPGDQQRITHSAHAFFDLYGGIFRALPARARTSGASDAQRGTLIFGTESA